MVQGKRVTLTDVAADAGVSRATASLVVRGDGRLAHATRLRVMESMDRLDTSITAARRRCGVGAVSPWGCWSPTSRICSSRKWLSVSNRLWSARA